MKLKTLSGTTLLNIMKEGYKMKKYPLEIEREYGGVTYFVQGSFICPSDIKSVYDRCGKKYSTKATRRITTYLGEEAFYTMLQIVDGEKYIDIEEDGFFYID